MGYYDFDEEQKFRGGLVCIDVLSKYAVVVPIKTKNAEDVLEATKEALGKMGKKPKMIYTDDERAIAGEDFKDYVEGEGITLHRTRFIPLLLSVLYAPTRICFLKEWRLMKKRERQTYNGLITI